MQQENLVPLPSFKMESHKTLCNCQRVAEQLGVHFTQVLSQTAKTVKFQHN